MNSRYIILFLLGLLLSACASTSLQIAETDAKQVFSLDNMREATAWTLDSADNYGEVKTAEGHEGKTGLTFSAFDNGRYKSMFRREVHWDLSGVSRSHLDVFNHASKGGVKLALAFKTKRGEFFETPAVELVPGWNRDVSFKKDGVGLKAGYDTAAWMAKRNHISRAMLLVFPGDNKRADVTISRWRVDAPGVDQLASPQLIDYSAWPTSLKQNALHTLTFTVKRNSLLRVAKAGIKVKHPSIRARLITPRGDVMQVQGYVSDMSDEDVVSYKLKFTPSLAGQWRAVLEIGAGHGWRQLESSDFNVKAVQSSLGFVSVDEKDPQYFSYSNGQLFYPVGQNVCWAADYEPYFKAIQAYGGNYARVWICPWNNPLIKTDGSGEINLASAQSIDNIFALAQQHGIRIQLVLAYHGWLKADWGRSPFNKALGGSCVSGEEFWIDHKARGLFKRYMQYCINRWAHHPALFAWELVNETDLTPRYQDKHIVSWHDEMGGYVKANDPYQRLVTTNVAYSPTLMNELYAKSYIDFIGSHRYHKRPSHAVSKTYALHRKWHKPYFVTEVGRDWKPAGEQQDLLGRHLQHSLWLAWMTPSAGNAMPWWWDTHIAPKQLYGAFKAVASFGKGEDRRGKQWQWLQESMSAGDNPVRLQAILHEQAIYGYLYREEDALNPQVPKTGTDWKSSVAFTGLLDGQYVFELVDPATGAVLKTGDVTCEDSQLSLALTLSEKQSGLAFKCKRSTALTPSLKP